MKFATVLPDKLSALLRVALKDLKAVEADPNYEVYMGEWHTPTHMNGKPVCLACFAGSVMAKSLNLAPTKHQGLSTFSAGTWRKFYALNAVRTSNIDVALMHLDVDPEKISSFSMKIKAAGGHITRYETNKEKFHEDVCKLAAFLEEEGL